MPDSIGTLRQIILSVDDVDAAMAYYQDTYGLDLEVHDPGRWAAFSLERFSLALAGPGEGTDSDTAVLAVKVANLDLAAAHLRGRGGRLVGSPSEGGHERRVDAVDGRGARIVLYQPKGP
jgi:predicted enzyme related to lactoylglutathione lyase